MYQGAGRSDGTFVPTRFVSFVTCTCGCYMYSVYVTGVFFCDMYTSSRAVSHALSRP